jgi:hypothetical protein
VNATGRTYESDFVSLSGGKIVRFQEFSTRTPRQPFTDGRAPETPLSTALPERWTVFAAVSIIGEVQLLLHRGANSHGPRQTSQL